MFRFTRNRSVPILFSLCLFAVTCMLAGRTSADPCGMVPPVQVNADTPIKRVGAQKTYLFYRDGIESFVVRPGFSGKADNFGMLIPFPNVPSIRKVPNNIFPQLAAAVDPPEIRVQLRQFRALAATSDSAQENVSRGKKKELKYNQVRVRKKQAVGMYQTVVLEAGSAEALKNWMDEHDYRYPNKMDTAARDYVDAGWCFVAVKARVGSKPKANPKPGMRDADPDLPSGATFDGNVQAMGFRFRSDRLVAPMRLSAYNEGKLHNITYVLTDEPTRIRHIPKKFVRRQLAGEELYDHVTTPLPVRVIGGEWSDLSDQRKAQIRKRRDPDPKNGRAKELFAADLLAAIKDRLVHGYETRKKALLDIEEALDLRGSEIDDLNRSYLADQNRDARKKALKKLRDMTLTVVDGEFPRKILKRENLTFTSYDMPDRKNRPTVYNARQKGPADASDRGTLYEAAQPGSGDDGSPSGQGVSGGSLVVILLSTAVSLLFGFFLWIVTRDRRIETERGSVSRTGLVVTLTAAIVLTTALGAAAQFDASSEIEKLTDRDRAPAAIKRLVENRNASLPLLIQELRTGEDVQKRGWAIVALSRIGGKLATHHLKRVMNDTEEHKLVRTLAAAARVRMSGSLRELDRKLDWVRRFPALVRPIQKKMASLGGKEYRLHVKLIELVQGDQSLRQKLSDVITKFGADALMEVVTRADQTQVRRTAASYLGSLVQQGKRDDVVAAVQEAYRFRPDADEVPWVGGPLFLPRLKWTTEEARSIGRELLAWKVRANERGDGNVENQIHNNLRSIRFRRAVGLRSVPNRHNTVPWLVKWYEHVSKEDVRELLKQQGLLDQDPYNQFSE